MGRVMAIDYGTKRVGLAVTDVDKKFAFPLETVSTPKIFDYIQNYAQKEPIECFVIGLPLHRDETPAQIEIHIVGFIRKLKELFPDVEIVRVDERLSSKIAFQTLIEANVPKQKRRDKSLLDKISAAIILQSYLQSIENK